MSTNYYIRPLHDGLEKFGALHIGKYSGLQFGFHGIRIEGGEQSVDVGSGVYFKVNVPRLILTTADEWKKFLIKTKKHGGMVHNEYGYFFTVEEFMKKCWDKPTEERKLEFMRQDWGRKEDRWIDPDGYCFSGYEFS